MKDQDKISKFTEWIDKTPELDLDESIYIRLGICNFIRVQKHLTSRKSQVSQKFQILPYLSKL